MKRFIALFLSTVVTVVLVITVLAAGQTGTPQADPAAVSAPAITTDAVQSAPVSDAFALPQFETGHREHDGNEHHRNNTSNLSLSDD